jgi:hypothetical protein
MKNLGLVLGCATAMIGLATALINLNSSTSKSSTTSITCIDSSNNINFGKQTVIIPGSVICADNIQLYSEK